MKSIKPIGKIHSSLKSLKDCPLQETEGAPGAFIVINKQYKQAMMGLRAGDKILLLTWLHKAHRKTLTTRPRNNPDAKKMGVFATRSPDRPNPIGVHTAEIVEVNGLNRIRISNLEVIDGTPLIDIKISLDA